MSSITARVALDLAPRPVDDEALLRRLREGDEAAAEELVRQHGPRMLAVIQRYVRDEDDARDALQDAFMSVCRAVDRFEGKSQFGTWLHRIAANAALMKLRSKRRRPACSIEELLPTFEADGHRHVRGDAWTASPDALLEREELRATVREKISLLPDDFRNVIILRDIEGLDTDATAAALGVTSGAVKTRLHRARMALRGLLETELLS